MNFIAKIMYALTIALMMSYKCFANGNVENSIYFEKKINISEAGHPQGINLKNKNIHGGVRINIPKNKIITKAKLDILFTHENINLANNLTLRVMINGQLIESYILKNLKEAEEKISIDLPPSLLVNKNDFSFSLIANDENSCTINNFKSKYGIMISPESALILEGIEFNLGANFKYFPEPFYSQKSVFYSDIMIVLPSEPSTGTISAAATVASWFGTISDQDLNFKIYRGVLPAANAIVLGHSNEMVAGVQHPDTNKPMVKIIDHPDNNIYKLLIITGNNDEQLRLASLILGSNNLKSFFDTAQVKISSLPVSKPYDAPKWIDTTKPIMLNELISKDENLESTGFSHDSLFINFNTAPDLYIQKGKSFPLALKYHFSESKWVNEQNSNLSVSFNNKPIAFLPIITSSIQDRVKTLLGFNARNEEAMLKFDPTLLFGNNTLRFYFDVKPVDNIPCDMLHSQDITSFIDGESFIDLSMARNFTQLPQLRYFLSNTFPYTKLADFSETLFLLSKKPTDREIELVLLIAARAGKNTGTTVHNNSVALGLSEDIDMRDIISDRDVIMISTLDNKEDLNRVLAKTPWSIIKNKLSMEWPSLSDRVFNIISGNVNSQQIQAYKFLNSNQVRRGFLSFKSPWKEDRIFVLAFASDAQELIKLGVSLNSEEVLSALHGDMILMTNNGDAQSFRVGTQFISGNLPIDMKVMWYINKYVVLLGVVAFVFILLLIITIWPILTERANKRLNG